MRHLLDWDMQDMMIYTHTSCILYCISTRFVQITDSAQTYRMNLVLNFSLVLSICWRNRLKRRNFNANRRPEFIWLLSTQHMRFAYTLRYTNETYSFINNTHKHTKWIACEFWCHATAIRLQSYSLMCSFVYQPYLCFGWNPLRFWYYKLNAVDW